MSTQAASGSAHALDQMTLLASLAVTELYLAGDQASAGLTSTLTSTLQAIQSVPLETVSGALVDPPELIGGLMAAIVHALTDMLHAVDLADPALSPMARGLLTALEGLSAADAPLLVAAAAGAIALLAASLRGRGDDVEGDGDAPLPDRYDVAGIEAYMSRRPMMVLRRTLVISAEFLHFGSLLLTDWYTGRWEAHMDHRAEQARELVERLGPTYIKLAQLMSTRVDMFPKPYIAEFTKLQDRVRPFETEQARDILMSELGRAPEEVFAFLSERPVAAASIGQVYRGRLRDAFGGGEVAVKVQRPQILANSALDLSVLRKILAGLTLLPGFADRNDFVALLDEWSSRFFLEMDYTHEANNALKFKSQMSALDGVTVAHVYTDLSTRRVLTTDWVRGEKLSESRAEDVKSLVTTMLNCYLIQLLETGFLHAGERPGPGTSSHP